MKQLENITFKEFTELDDYTQNLYNYTARYSRKLNQPLDLFGIGDFTKLTFGQIKDLQYTFEKGIYYQDLFNFVIEVKGIKLDKIVNKTFFHICKFRRFVEMELDKIQQLESNLNFEASTIDRNAGIEELNQFGVMLQIDKLAGGDITKYDNIRALPYDICFAKLLMDKKTDEYKANINKIMLSNNKNK